MSGMGRYGIKTRRVTLEEMAEKGRLNETTRQLFLYVMHTFIRRVMGVYSGEEEVSVVYFRAGYHPKEYTSERLWQARRRMERSRAVITPNAAQHLAGTKKIQQVLAQPGGVERFLDNPEEVAQVRATFAHLWSLDDPDPALLQNIVDDPDKYVLKPQLEGGGNNMYDQDMVMAVQSMSKEELASYILMERLRPPRSHANVLVREGKMAEEEDTVSELGVYGVWLSHTQETVRNEATGWLLRTKPRRATEGGVASGFAVLNTPRLLP